MKNRLLLGVALVTGANASQALELRIGGTPIEVLTAQGLAKADQDAKAGGASWTVSNGLQTYRIYRGGAIVLEQLEKLQAEGLANRADSKVANGAAIKALDTAIDDLRAELSQGKLSETVSQSANGLCDANLDLTATFQYNFWTTSVNATFTFTFYNSPPSPRDNYIHVWARVNDLNNGNFHEDYDVAGPFGYNVYQNVSASVWAGPSNIFNHDASAWGYYNSIGCDHYLFAVFPTGP